MKTAIYYYEKSNEIKLVTINNNLVNIMSSTDSSHFNYEIAKLILSDENFTLIGYL